MCDECVWVTIIVTATVSVHRSPPSGRYAPFRGSTDFSRGLRCWYTTRVTRLVTHTLLVARARSIGTLRRLAHSGGECGHSRLRRLCPHSPPDHCELPQAVRSLEERRL